MGDFLPFEFGFTHIFVIKDLNFIKWWLTLDCPFYFLINVKSVSGDELSEPSRKRRKHDSGPRIQCQICDLSLSGDVQHYSHYLSAHPDQPDLHPPRSVHQDKLDFHPPELGTIEWDTFNPDCLIWIKYPMLTLLIFSFE